MAGPKDYPPPTLEEAERALNCIPADCPEAEWKDCGMAIASEFPTTGFPVFDRWSAQAPDKYDAADLKSRWRRWTQGKGKNIATLFFADLWAKAPPAPASHGYLVRKGI